MTLVDHGFSTTFTSTQLERLQAYKGAVTAGLYSDWDGSAEVTDRDTLAWLAQPIAARSEAYPFTPDETERLEACRAAIAAGYYSEDVPKSNRQPFTD